MSTLAISQNFNAQSITWAGTSTLWALLRTLALLLLGGALLAGVFAVAVAFWLPICQIAGCIGIIVAFAYATFPKSKAVRK